MPTYNHAQTISETLDSILIQNFADFEIIISDDGSEQSYDDVLEKYKKDLRIKWHLKQNNLGYCGNLRRAISKATGEIILFFASDDIMGKGCLQYYSNIFDDFNVEAIARTYYAFDKSPYDPIRAKPILESEFEIVNACGPYDRIKTVFCTLDQLSGLAYRSDATTVLPNDDVFPAHAYPIADIFTRTGRIGYISKDFLAVRVSDSQCINISKIYDKSPVESWHIFILNFFKNSRYIKIYKYLKKYWVSINAVGMFQIANFSSHKYRFTLREYFNLIQLNPLNLFSIQLLFATLMCLLLPRSLLIRITNFAKLKINKHLIRSIKFEI